MINYVISVHDGTRDLIPLVAGQDACSPSHSYGPFIRDHYIIHFVLSGQGTLINREGERRASAGELFIIRPGETATYTADPKNPWRYLWLSFIGAHAGVFEGGEAVREIPEGIAERLEALVTAVEKAPEPFSAIIYDLIYRLYTAKELPPEDAAERVRRYILHEYMTPITAEEIARAFGYDRTYLYRIFKARFGCGVKHFLTETRMTHARALLKDGSHTVAECACMVGYRDEFNFSKAFKKHFGTPPGALKP